MLECMWKIAKQAHRLWLNVEPYIAPLNWFQSIVWASVVATLTAFWSWVVSTIQVIQSLGWGVWLILGLVLTVLSLVAVLLAFAIRNLSLMRQEAAGAAPTEPIVSASPTGNPIGETSPSLSRLPSAAELLEEQELRDTVRDIGEFIEGSANDARSDLGGVIAQAATLDSYSGTKHSKALKFFVQDAVNRGYTAQMKEMIREIRQALSDRSIDRAQQNLAKFMTEYRHGQRCLGILITATSMDPASVQGYDGWLKSDERCVREFRDLASRPLLRTYEPIRVISKEIVMASEQDFSNVDLEGALAGHFTFTRLSP